ncbi:hypothetical protein D3C79_652600 [compost metagenome]
MAALANGDRPRRIGAGALGGGRIEIAADAADAGGAQLQGVAGVDARQHAEVALFGDQQLQAAAGQGLLHGQHRAHPADDRRRLLALYQRWVQRNDAAALAGDGIEGAGQGGGGQVEAQGLFLGLDGAGQRGQGHGDRKGVGPRVEHGILLIMLACQEIGAMRNENRTQIRVICINYFCSGVFARISVSHGLY